MIKRLALVALSLVLFIGFPSCGNDDEGSSNLGAFVFNGNNYTVNNGVVVDDGISTSGTHYELYFVISDAPVEITAIPNTLIGFEAPNSSIAMNFILSSIGNSFEPGTFVYDNFGNDAASFFDVGAIYIDGNGDNELNDPEDSIISMNGGTITVSGNSPNYVIDFNISFTNGESLEFRYDGGFDYIDNRG